ncbi:phosphoadenosine phosphosulfate reductase domain-containing protein [Bradyrhizobium cenepequi]
MIAIATSPEIDALLAVGAPVAIGVSGGKDSQAATLAAFAHLDRIGHRGPRVLIHSDLGSVEWSDSLPVCERLAAHLGVELIVVRRAAGDLMDRWESRWASSVRRYANLETVTLVLPWSTPSMRFCTSELKTHVIAAELKRRFKGRPFVNITGIRRQESAARARGSVSSPDSSGKFWSWRLISDWSVDQVFDRIATDGLLPHEAYSRGMSRVSCRFCIMSNEADLKTAAAAPESHDLYRRMVGLEIASTFAFQGSRWLGDIAPHLLDDRQRAGLAEAKKRAAVRVSAESQITKDMLYVKGWPTRMLTDAEASILAGVRQIVSRAIGFVADYLDVAGIHRRYAELMALAAAKGGAA